MEGILATDNSKSYTSTAKMAVFKLAKEERSKPMDAVCLPPPPTIKEEEDEQKEVKAPPKKATRSKRSQVAESVSDNIKEELKAAKAASKTATSTRKRKLAAKGKTPSAALMPPPSTGVRRSTRKRVPRNLEMETPSNPKRPQSMSLITPKFDMATPLSRTVMRLAKPNETLVSLSGSPVYAGNTTTAKKRGKKKVDDPPENLTVVPLGKGKMMMLPMSTPKVAANEPDAKIELDDEEKERLVALRSQLDNMLNLAKTPE